MFLDDPTTPEAVAYLREELAADGYVPNYDRAWAWRADIAEGFVALRKQLMDGTSLTQRELAVLVCATAHAVGDSYCATAWGGRLAALSDPALAAEVLRGQDGNVLTRREAALRRWAEQVVREPNSATKAQVDGLRSVGLSDKEIFEATAFIAFRLAFSTVNDALGATPDQQLVAAVPAEVRDAVTYGRAAT